MNTDTQCYHMVKWHKVHLHQTLYTSKLMFKLISLFTYLSTLICYCHINNFIFIYFFFHIEKEDSMLSWFLFEQNPWWTNQNPSLEYCWSSLWQFLSWQWSYCCQFTTMVSHDISHYIGEYNIWHTSWLLLLELIYII